MDYYLDINNITVYKKTMCIIVSGKLFGCSLMCKPKLILHFVNSREDRYIPMVLQSVEREKDTCSFSGVYMYKLDKIFWETRNNSQEFSLSFDLMADDELEENVKAVIREDHLIAESDNYRIKKKDDKEIFFDYKKTETKKSRASKIKKVVNSLTARNSTETDDFQSGLAAARTKRPPVWMAVHKLKTGIKRAYIIFWYGHFSKKPVNEGQIAFMSQRSNKLTDNMMFIYDELSKDTDIKCVSDLTTKTFQDTSLKRLYTFSKLAAQSKVILIDEYVPALYFLNIRKETKFIQVWHACGAFKTVGYSRLGKTDAPIQSSKAHRNYDYSVVSSSNVRRWYAEAFGLPLRKVISLGVPRTDIFFDESYRDTVTAQIREAYPQISGKKVILFAPTFRGTIKSAAYYPFEKADLADIIDKTGDDYVILLRHHPFVSEKHPFPKEYADRIIDVGDYPSVNDLLFVTDILITDYSSVVFEASLCDIPMLFYAFDMEEYISERDFYFSYTEFVPGKIVKTNEELINAINCKDFEHEKVRPFAEKYFDIRDGRATQRVCDMLRNYLR